MNKHLLITYKTTDNQSNDYMHGIFHLNYSDDLTAPEKVNIILQSIADAYNTLMEKKFNLIKKHQVIIINSLEI